MTHETAVPTGRTGRGTGVIVNGRRWELEAGCTLVDLLARMTGRELAPDGSTADGGRLGIAVAVDGAVIPRSRWQTTRPAEGEEIEIISAMQGG